VPDAAPRPTLAARAESDLDDIWRWIADESGPERADAFMRQIKATTDLFAGRPLAGRPQPELGAEIRSFLVRPYLIYYRPRPWGLEIVRVLYTRRDRDTAWRDQQYTGS
jgi:toxin ParE1/3/4